MELKNRSIIRTMRRGKMPKTALIILTFVCLSMAACAATKTGPPVSQAGTRDFDFYMRQGSIFLGRAEYREARECFDQAISLNSGSDRAHNLRGVASLNLNDFGAAEGDLREAVRLNPSYAEAFNNLGALYFIQHKLESAEEAYKKALSLNPDSVATNYSLGTLLMLLGRREEGVRHLAHGIELDPDYLATHKFLAAGVPSSGEDVSELYLTFARLYASKGDAGRTLEFLQRAKAAGFRNWSRIAEEKEFENVLADPRIKEFLQRN
jgi:tetratricopeptide (TPR) repeat protein